MEMAPYGHHTTQEGRISMQNLKKELENKNNKHLTKKNMNKKHKKEKTLITINTL